MYKAGVVKMIKEKSKDIFSKLVLSLAATSLLLGCGGGDDIEKLKNSNDAAITEKIVEKNSGSLMPWVDNKKLAIEKLKEKSSVYSMLSSKLKKDRELVEVALKNKLSLYMLDKNFLKDKSLMLISLKYNPESFNTMDESLKTDPDILLASLKSRYNGAIKNIDYAPDNLKSDPDFVIKVLETMSDKQRIEHDYHSYSNKVLFPYINGDLKKNKTFIKNALAVSGSLLCDLDESFRGDRKLALIAVTQHGRALTCLNKKLLEDKEIALIAVNQDGSALASLLSLGSSLADDKEVVLAAVKQARGEALWGVNEKFRQDKDVIKLLEEKVAQ